jgi:superfamily II DNA or RNA helicase
MTSDTLEAYIEEFRLTHFGEEFVWRKGQREAISEIINVYYSNYKTVILDAPVGSGKLFKMYLL